MIIVWDEPKRQANLVKHGIDFADIDEGFFLSSLVGPPRQRQGKEAAGMSKPETPVSTEADLAAVMDNPELTAEEVAAMVPFAQALPELAAKMRRRGRQQSPTKQSTTIRLSPEVLAHFRATGPGWQSRIDDVLRNWVASH